MFDADQVHGGAAQAPAHGGRALVITSTAMRKVVAGTRYLADVTVSSEGISGWLKDNALPLIMLIIGLGLLGASRKGDTSKVMLTIGLVAASLAVVAIGLDSSLGLGIGKWLLSLLGLQATSPPAPPSAPAVTTSPAPGG
jgi:hypothetical protein